MNRYTTEKLSNVVTATNDADPITGITGARWIGCNPNDKSELGNIGDGDAIVYSANQARQDSIITKLVSITMPDTLTINKTHFIQCTLGSLGFSNDAEIIGFNCVGVSGVSANPANSVYVLNFREVFDSITISRVRNSLVVEIPSNRKDNLESKRLNIIVYYR